MNKTKIRKENKIKEHKYRPSNAQVRSPIA